MTDYVAEDTATTEDAVILARSTRQYDVATESWTKQLEREQDDLRWQVPENQWDPAARAQREGQDGTPPRPILSISKIDQPLQLVSNQFRAADLGINVHPISEEADDDTAEMLQGLIRHIERDSQAELARSWAFDRARAAGRGAYRILKVYDPNGGHPLDQKLVITRILHQEGVLFDPAAEQPDYSDGEYAFVLSWVSRDDYRRQFPKAKRTGANAMEWASMVAEAPGWVRDEDMLVVEYWYKEHKFKKLCLLDDWTIIDKSETGPDYKPPKGRKIISEHELDEVTVHVCKRSGFEKLDGQEWDGKHIPLVPVIGRELVPFDGERIYHGMIRPARDGQRLYNYGASTLVEDLALESKVPYVGAEGQFAGHEKKWGQANTRNFPYLEYKPVSLNGTLAPPPQRMQVDSSRMQLAMMTLQEADRFIQATTAVYDQSLGRKRTDESGKAILALQQQSDASTSHYLDNAATISIPLEAKILLDLIPHVYSRPGRVARILQGDDDTTEMVMLNAPYTMDPRRKRPVMAQDPNAQGVKQYTLKPGAHYDVSVTVGKSFQTKLEHGAEFTAKVVESAPDLMMLIGDLVFRYRDDPGAKEIAERLGKIIDQQHPNLRQGKDGQPSPEQMAAKAQAMEMELQAAGQQVQQLTQMLQTEQAKQQATMAKAQMDNEAKVQTSAADNAARVEIARMNNEVKLMIAQMEARFSERLTALEHANETRGRHEEMSHEVAMAAAGGRTMQGHFEDGQEMGQERTDETSQAQGESTAPEQPGGDA